MPKLAFHSVPAHGHINPTLAVASELVRRGSEVIYYSTEAFRPRIEATGAVFRNYGEPLLDENPSERVTKNPLLMAGALGKMTRRLLPRLRREAERERFDGIVYDSFALWGKLLAEVLELPAVGSVTMLVQRPRIGRLLQLLSMLPDGLAGLRELRQESEALRAECGRSLPGFREIFSPTGPLNLVYTSREFQPEADQLDSSFQFVGPSVAARGDDATFPFERLANRRVLYVSMGTLYSDRPDFYRACLRAFADLDAAVVFSVGRHLDLEALGDLPSNAFVHRYVPQIELLQRTDLFITHGGMNSISEALYFGVPLLVVAQTQEQALNGERVREVGAGRVLKASKVSAETLWKQVGPLLAQPSYRAASSAMGDTFRAAGGPPRAAEQILSHVASSRRP